MKRIWIACMITLMAGLVHAQDDRYYQNNSSGGDDVYTGDDNSYSEQELDQTGTSYQTFYDDLDDYGNWVQSPTYGYMWVPLQAGAGFQPYMTDGHWEYTEYGWTWVSDFPWGWATFHYGRWNLDPGYGWVWIPGSLWAPAWVVWGQYEGYYCWAPLWPGEYTSTHYGSREHNWYFTQQNHIVDHDLSAQIVNNTVVNHDGGSIEPHIIQISHVNTLNRATYFSGPKQKDVEKLTGRNIERVNITAAPKPQATTVSNGAVSIYRPAIKLPARSNPNEGMQRTGGEQMNSPQRTEPGRNMSVPRQEQPTRQEPARQQQQWSAPAQNSAPVQMQRTEQPAYQRQEPAQRPMQIQNTAPVSRPAPVQQQQPVHIEAPMSRPAAPPARMGGPRR